MITADGTNTTYVLQNREELMDRAQHHLSQAITILKALETTYRSAEMGVKADGISHALELARRSYHQVGSCRLGFYSERE